MKPETVLPSVRRRTIRGVSQRNDWFCGASRALLSASAQTQPRVVYKLFTASIPHFEFGGFMFQRILVCLDSNDTSSKALSTAVQLGITIRMARVAVLVVRSGEDG